MPGRPDINPVIAQVTADTPGALPVYGGRDGQTITGYQVPQNVGSPPATQAELDAANAMRDAISKQVGTTVDFVYPQTRVVHDGNLAEDTNAAPIGFRFDNGQSQYVGLDLNGNVTGVQQRGGGFAQVLPFIEKAVEFVFPATIPFIEGANAAYALSQGNYAGALAGLTNTGLNVPGVDASTLSTAKTAANYVNGANALAKGDLGTFLNSASQVTSDPTLKTIAQDASIANAVATGKPSAIFNALTGSIANNTGVDVKNAASIPSLPSMGGGTGLNISLSGNAITSDLPDEPQLLQGSFLNKNNADIASGNTMGATDKNFFPGVPLTSNSDIENNIAKNFTPKNDTSKLIASAEDTGGLSNDALVNQVAGWNPTKTTMSGGEQTASADESGLPVSSDILDRATKFQPVEIAGKQLTADELPALPDVTPLGGYESTNLAPVTVTGNRNVITDSGLPVDQNIGTSNASAELAPVTVTGTRGNNNNINTITDSGLPVDANVGTTNAAAELAPVTITGSRKNNIITDSALPVDQNIGTSNASTALAPVTITGTRGDNNNINTITDSGLPVDASVGYHNPVTDLGRVTIQGDRGNNVVTDSSLPVNADVGQNVLNSVDVVGKRNLITDSGLPIDANVGTTSAATELAPVTVTGSRGNNLITDSGLPVDANVGASNTALNPVTVTGTRGNNTITDSALPVNADVGQNVLNSVDVTGKRNLITDSGLPVDANVGLHKTDAELAPVTITGSRGNNLITDSSLPVNADVGTNTLSPVTITGTRGNNLITDSALPVNADVGTNTLSPVTITGSRGNNTITDSSLPVNADVGTNTLSPVTITGTRGNNLITDSALPVNADVGTNTLSNVEVTGKKINGPTDLDTVTVTGKKENPLPLTVDELPALPTVTPLPPVVLPPVVPPVVKPPVVPPVVPPVTPTTTGGLPTINDPTGIAGKVLTLGKMGDSKHYEEGLKQLSIPELKRWEELNNEALSNVDVFKNMQALNAQYPYQYAQGGAVQNFAGGGASDVQAMLDSANKADVMDALKGLSNLSSGLEPLKGKMMQLGQVGVAGQQKPLQQMSVIPQLAAILQVRGMKFADGGRADHEHPEYDGIPVFRTGGLDGLGGKYVEGKGDGTSDDITAMLANGEYVFSADVVSALGNGSNKAGAKELDHMVKAIRARARSAPPDKLPPDAKSPLEYLSKGKKYA